MPTALATENNQSRPEEKMQTEKASVPNTAVEPITPQNIITDSTVPALNSTPVESINPNESNRIQQALQENPWMFLHAYKANYEISAEGDKLGNATRELTFEQGQWNVQMSTKLKKWFITFKSKEYSNFIIDNDALRTLEFYSSTILSFKKDRIIHQLFDWKNHLENGTRDEHQWQLPLEAPVFDRMSHLVQIRADLLLGQSQFDYVISYKGKRVNYSYELVGKEIIKSSFGEFETVKLVRTKGDDSSFSIWFSPELNYFPVKIAQYEQDKPDVEMLLSNLEFIPFEKVAKK